MQDVAIVTEFMSKGSLRDVLNGAGAPPPPHGRASCANPTSIRHSGAAPKAEQVDWLLVLNMALDAAMGINYLHTAESPIIHRDIKVHQ
jgi:serine/threonine protein kinase